MPCALGRVSQARAYAARPQSLTYTPGPSRSDSMKFTYRCGQQPLPGYTIKRGIGWGGFGEVYFAVTDSGKDVALKWIRSNLDPELRGRHQFLNPNHPHLLHVYAPTTDPL